MPVLLTYFGKKSGVKGGRSLTYVLGNMLSAGGTTIPPATQFFHLPGTEVVVFPSLVISRTAAMYAHHAIQWLAAAPDAEPVVPVQ